MKKIILFVFLSSLLAAGVYFYMEWRTQQQPVEAWACIPQTSAIALEVHEPQLLTKQWSKSLFWKNIAPMPAPAEWTGLLLQLDSLLKTHELPEVAQNKTVFVSLHAVGREEIGYLFCYDLNQEGSVAALSDILKGFQNHSAIKFQEHLYQKTLITEITHLPSGKKMSLAQYKNILICSFTSVLVEDAIRTASRNETTHFVAEQKKTFKSTPHENGHIVAYVNYAYLPDFVSVVSPSLKSYFEPMKHIAQAATMEITPTNELLLANGFSTLDNTHFLSVFAPQKPSETKIYQYVPNKTAVFYHFNFSNGSKFGSNLDGYRHRHLDEFLAAKEQLHEKQILSPGELYSWWGKEIALCLLETVDADDTDKLLFVQAADKNEAAKMFKKLTERVQQKETPIYIEQYQGYEIRQIPLADFPGQWLGNPFGGFTDCFYMFMDDYVVMANNIQSLRTLIADIDHEDVWAKSAKAQSIIKELNNNSHLTMAVNTARCWSFFQENAGDVWKNMMNNFPDAIRNVTWLAAQYNVTETKSQTSLLMKLQPERSNDASNDIFKVKYDTYFQYSISTPAKVLRNPDNQSLETLVLDSAQQLFLLDKEGQITFKQVIGEKVVSDFTALLQSKNQQQFAYVTDKKLHLIDRTGAAIEGFPVKLPDSSRIAHLAVFDYEKKQNYRFLAANTDGLLFMFDENAKPLEGWNPRRLPSKLATAPIHVNINGKDGIIALTAAGKLYMLTRKGELYAGFPIDLKGRFESPLLFEQGTSFDNSIITTLSEQGELLSYNLKGKEMKREQIYKPAVNTTFTLCPDPLGKTYAVARQTDNRIAMFNSALKPVFEKEYKNANRLPVQYYNFGSGNEVFAVTDPAEERTFLYDKMGTLLQGKPVESVSPICLLYSEASESFFLYRHFGHKTGLVTFRK